MFVLSARGHHPRHGGRQVIRLSIATASLILVLVLGMHTANADSQHAWSSSATGCVAGDTAAGKLTITGGSVKFNSTSSGQFQVYCPITNMEVDDANTL